jgi:TetR/AcrR family transcriptional regulator
MNEWRAHRRDGAQTREAILAEAERLFAQRGFGGASLEQIGHAAGLSRGTPGYFFGVKERLYDAVVERILERARLRLRPVYDRLREAGADDEDQLADLVRTHLELLAEDPALVRLLQWESLGGQGKMLDELAAHAPDLLDVLRSSTGAQAERDLLLSAVSLCWFPFAYADAITRTLGLDPRSPDFLALHTEGVVGYLRARVLRPTS